MCPALNTEDGSCRVKSVLREFIRSQDFVVIAQALLSGNTLNISDRRNHFSIDPPDSESFWVPTVGGIDLLARPKVGSLIREIEFYVKPREEIQSNSVFGRLAYNVWR